ncbi:MAG: choice-of-anchor D domain-containing protein [Acidobacteriaceae bacterium]
MTLRRSAVELSVPHRRPSAEPPSRRLPLFAASFLRRAAVSAALVLFALLFVPSQATAQAPVPTWQPVGPSQVNTAGWNLITGSVISLAADPSDASGNTVYLGTAGGGVWKSTNAASDPGSAQFLPLTDTYTVPTGSLSSLSMGAVSVQPGGTGVILAGTGDPNGTPTSWYGVGILRSADNGNTWSLIQQSAIAPSGIRFNFAGTAFAGFAWSTITSGLVVAAVGESEYADIAGANNAQSALGIYYSLDAGAPNTWQLATLEDGSSVIQSDSVTGSANNAATSVVWNPVRRSFFAAIRYHGYYESADGITWSRLANQPGTGLTPILCPTNPSTTGSPACPIFRGAIAAQPATGDLFALTVDQNNNDQGLWRDACNLQPSGACSSGTVQFATRIPDQPLESTSGNGTLPESTALALAAVPAQQDTLLFVGLTDLWRCSLASGCVWRNTTNTGTCAAAQVAPGQQAIDSTFGASGLLYFGTQSGLWRSTDAVAQQSTLCSPSDATHFQNLNAGLGSLAAVASFAENPNNCSTWLAALGPLGTAAPSAGGGPWNQVLDGEGDVVAIDPLNPQNWYATSVFGVGINACSQGAACTVADFGTPVIGESQVGNDVQTLPAPWILDPANSSNLILGTCRVWRGLASGAGWSASNLLSSILDGESGAFCNGNAEIRSLAAGLTNTDTRDESAEQLYAGMAGVLDGGGLIPGHILTAEVHDGSSASSTQWTDLYASPVVNSDVAGAQFNPGAYDVSSIFVDPHDPTGQTLYVTIQGIFGGTTNANLLYTSTDGGAHWTNLSANLPQAPANSVLVDPNNANIVYVALDTGVYITQNVTACSQPNAACWNVYGSGLPMSPVTSLMAYNEGSVQALRAATGGRGIWQIPLATAGVAPTTATLNPSALTFATQTLQTLSTAQTVTLTNTGHLNLNISSVTASGDFIETDSCAGQSVAPESTCEIQVSFDPSQSGTRSGSLTVFANLTGGQITASLSGTGLGQAAIQLIPASLNFGALAIGATSSSQSVAIANTGAQPETLTSETAGGDFHITANTCTNSLAAGASCTVSIVFNPSASGSRAGALTVVSSLGVETAPLSGTGQTPATDGLSPSSLAFAVQQIGTTSPAQTVTLTNTGDQPLTGIIVTSTGDFTVVNNCGTLLQGQGSCAITVAYAPTRTGAETGTLTVADEIRNQTVSLRGTGQAPPGVSATPSSINFGGYAVGTTSSPQTVTVTNSGGIALTNLFAIITAGFAIAANQCPATLAAGAACPLSITFSPTAAGAVSGTLTLSAGNLAKPLTVALTGSGNDFSLSIVGSSSAAVTSGQSASYTLQLASLGGTSGTLALSCSGAPQNATCTLNPAGINLTSANPVSSTVTIVTGVAASAALRPALPWKPLAPLLTLAVPLAAFGLRRRRLAAFLVLLAACLVSPLGCGVSSSSGSGGGGSGGGGSGTGGSANSTPSGTYTLTVAATMSNITHTTTLTLTVQ